MPTPQGAFFGGGAAHAAVFQTEMDWEDLPAALVPPVVAAAGEVLVRWSCFVEHRVDECPIITTCT